MGVCVLCVWGGRGVWACIVYAIRENPPPTHLNGVLRGGGADQVDEGRVPQAVEGEGGAVARLPVGGQLREELQRLWIIFFGGGC